jgi:hypothetical protein
MSEVLLTSNLSEWTAAAVAVQHNQALAAIFTVTDAATAEQAVEYLDDSRGVLFAKKLPPEFLEALKISHNASHPCSLDIDENVTFHAYTQGATGLHADGGWSEDEVPLPLTANFTARGSVEVTYVALTKDEVHVGSNDLPSRLVRLTSEGPGIDCYYDKSENIFLPRAQGERLGKIAVISAGQLSMHSGWADLSVGRLPVAHQFIAQGATPEERNRRTGVFINTDLLL